ncbi:hypothetical protein [Acidisphaera sp. S103]|uniref:hypothetical protein n=1 Tax=Acidisphaera sp. S103 TaxID=1747223 RepID=UPI00131AF6A3|nr:hypothetical protein [Acidisphaera sp. S103]
MKDKVRRAQVLDVWRAVADWLAQEDLLDDGRLVIRALFEFAAKSREMDVASIVAGIKGWGSMPIAVDVEGTIVAKQIFDQGAAKGDTLRHAAMLRRYVLEKLEDLGLSDASLQYASTLLRLGIDDLEALQKLSRRCQDSRDIADAIAQASSLRYPNPDISPAE